MNKKRKETYPVHDSQSDEVRIVRTRTTVSRYTYKFGLEIYLNDQKIVDLVKPDEYPDPNRWMNHAIYNALNQVRDSLNL